MAIAPASSNSLLKVRIVLFAIVVTAGFCAMAARLYWVQIKRHEELLAQARRRYTSYTTIIPRRGEILDRNGNLLVGNIPCEELTCDPSIVGDADKCRQAAQIIQQITGIPFDETYPKLMRKTRTVTDPETGETVEKPVQYAMLGRNIPIDKALRLREVLKNNKYGTGFFFHESYMRNYPKGKLLANILGYTKMEKDRMIPLAGLEKLLDQELSGTFGKQRYERDIAGRPLYYGEVEELAVRHNGLNVCLTIDEVIQGIVEEELDNVMETIQPEAVYAVMLDPKTCDILAIAQRPTFDPGNRTDMDRAGRLRIIEDVFEPGSIMKALTVAGAIDRGVVRPETTYYCEHGRWMFLNRPLTDTHDYTNLTVGEIIQKSSNIGSAKIAIDMGKYMLNDVLRSFGIGSRTGIPLSPESPGLFPRVEKWDGLSISRFSIGYGIAVTPLQMARAYCALADNGNLRPVRLIDRCIDPETGIETVWERPEPVKIFRRAETTREMMEMMKMVTKPGGTAPAADVPGYYVAGKTGTARKHAGGGYTRKYFASFAGIVPADNPAFVLLITADSPKTSSYGGTVAGPAFRRISERVLKYMNIQPHPDLIEEYNKAQKKEDSRR